MKRIVRCVLELLGYALLLFAVTVAIMGLTKTLIGDWESGGPGAEILGDGLLTSLGIALTNVVIFGLFQSREVLVGWPRVGPGLRWFAKGGLAGFAMASVMLLLTLASGGARLVFETNALQAYFQYVLLLGCGLLLAALGEEWLFRGYPLMKLAGLLGRGWANLLMSLMFAAAHLRSAGAASNPMVTVNIVLGSLVVGALRFTPGGIPAAWGFHFVWNYTQLLCGADLSLENIHVPGVTYSAAGPVFLSGGAFGPEAGIGATISTALVLILLLVYFRRQGAHDLPIPLGRPHAPNPECKLSGSAPGGRG